MENNLTVIDQLESSRKYIRADMENLAQNFIKLGYHLYEVQRYKYYEADGYTSVAEFAETEFGIKKSTCFNLIKCVQAYSVNQHSMFLDDKYKKFGYSQLVEMLSLPDYGKGKVSSDMSVSKIREIKKFGALVDEQKIKGEIQRYCDLVSEDIKPFTFEKVRDDIAKRCEYHHCYSPPKLSFSPGFIEGENYHYTPALFLQCIEKYVGFDEPEEENAEPVQTSGLEPEIIEEAPHITFQERHDLANEIPLEDVLMELLRCNIKYVDKVKAIIGYLNNL